MAGAEALMCSPSVPAVRTSGNGTGRRAAALQRAAAAEAALRPVPPRHPILPEPPAQEDFLAFDPPGKVHQATLGIPQDDALRAEGFDLVAERREGLPVLAADVASTVQRSRT